MADEGQQLEGDEVVAGLLGVPQQSPGGGEDARQHKQGGQGQRPARAQALQQGVAAQNGDEGGAEMPRQTHGDGQQHIAGEGFHQTHQPGHHGKSASLVHTAAPSFP